MLRSPRRMQLAFYPLLKLAVFSVMANTVAAVSLPEPVGLEARQTNSQCLLNLCNPGAATTGCCANSTCSGVSLLGLSIGVSLRNYPPAQRRRERRVLRMYSTCY